MEFEKHGLSIGMERIDSDIFLILKAVGKLTHKDYLAISPLLDAALEGVKHPSVNALLDVTEFDGWELRAAWDDLKLGLRHGNDFDKIAIYGNKPWERYMTSIGRWFMSGEMKYFEEYLEAVLWLKE